MFIYLYSFLCMLLMTMLMIVVCDGDDDSKEKRNLRFSYFYTIREVCMEVIRDRERARKHEIYEARRRWCICERLCSKIIMM